MTSIFTNVLIRKPKGNDKNFMTMKIMVTKNTKFRNLLIYATELKTWRTEIKVTQK